MDDARKRLLERIYSREGSAEESRDYVDPDTGAAVRMTPSQWALAEYDRRSRTDAAPPARSSASAERTPASRDRARRSDRPADILEPLAVSARADTRSERTAVGEDGALHSDAPDSHSSDNATASVVGGEHETSAAHGSTHSASHPEAVSAAQREHREHRRRTLRFAFAVVAAFAVGVGATLALGAVARTPTAAKATPTPTADGSGYLPLPYPALQEYFRRAGPAAVLPADVTAGYIAQTFHVVAGSAGLQQSSAIYAAKRNDDAYCLVAVADDVRVAATCATADGLAATGLSLSKDAVRDVDGRPVIVTVTWQRDGTLTWTMTPTSR